MSKIVLTAQAKKDLEEIKVYISHHLQNPTSAKNTIVGITKELRRSAVRAGRRKLTAS